MKSNFPCSIHMVMIFKMIIVLFQIELQVWHIFFIKMKSIFEIISKKVNISGNDIFEERPSMFETV